MSQKVVIEKLSEEMLADVAAIESSAAMSVKQLQEELARPWSRSWVLRTGSEPEAVAFLVSWHVADELHILNIATRADQRRRGFARRLMDHAIAFARTEKLRQMMLEVRRSNSAAIALYRSIGFYAMGIRKKYYSDDEDALEMVLLFDPATGEWIPHADEVQI